MRFASTLSIAAVGLVLLGCGSDGDAGGGGESGDREVAPATGTPSSGAGPGSGTAGDGGSDGPSSSSPATGVGGSDAGTSTGTGGGHPSEACLGANLLADFGRERLMVGASLTDELAETTPLDVRYVQLSGALADGEGPCESCAEGCTARDFDCSNDNDDGCDWWGCQQDDQELPGAYVRDFASTARERGQIPMVTYYLVLQSSGASAGVGELETMNDAAYLARYLADFRLMLQSLAGGPALVHVEPDFWGYAQQSNPDPHAIPVAVPAANPADCGDQESSLAGLGRCLVKMARIHAPQAKIGLHGSGWATGSDVLQNDEAAFDVSGHAAALAGFLVATAPDADLVFIDATNADAGFDAFMGDETFWDESNMTLPNFDQALSWSRTLSEVLGRPNLWWRLPFGNMSLPGGATQWKDNRLDYYLSHMNEVAEAHGVGVAFGAGDAQQVTAESDGGHFVERAAEYAASGGELLCAP